MEIQVLGTGCPNCIKLATQTEQAAQELGATFTLEKVTDITKIMEAGILKTPALVVDGVVRVSGRIPSMEEIKELLTTAQGGAK